METSAAQPAASPESLLQQALTDAPVRSVWIARHFTALAISVQVALDFLSVVAALLIANTGYRLLELGTRVSYPIDFFLLTAATVAAGFVLLMERYGLYRPSSSLLHIRETEAILRGTLWSAAVFLMTGYLLMRFVPSRWVVAFSAVLVFTLVIAQRTAFYGILRRLHIRGYGLDRVLIYGCTAEGIQVFRKLVQSPRAGLVPVGFVDDDASARGKRIFESAYTRRKSLSVVGTGEELDQILGKLQITRVILADTASLESKIETIRELCNKHGVQVSFVSAQHRLDQHQVNYLNLDGVMLAEILPIQESRVYRVTKRLLDLLFGSCMLVVGAPIMALIAVAIWKSDGLPVIFAQERVGQFGKVFRMIKFRTMYRESPPYAHTPKDQNDPRITPVGRFLRRMSLDELPQLFNVLRGEMSLVGPRPEMPFIVAQYSLAQRERLMAKPGLTGLWQLSADRAFEIHENIDYDLYYIRNRSILLDLVILLHTLIFAIRGVGAI
jgi:exopolysaccharide biosynthesis polyprenyl glycosylphosphotransferase